MTNQEVDTKEELWNNAQSKGHKLYERFGSWNDTPTIQQPDFDSLPTNIQHIWIMTALGKTNKPPKNDQPKVVKQPKVNKTYSGPNNIVEYTMSPSGSTADMLIALSP